MQNVAWLENHSYLKVLTKATTTKNEYHLMLQSLSNYLVLRSLFLSISL